jgi:hypothetical protein
MLQKHSSITALSVEECSLGGDGARTLVESLENMVAVVLGGNPELQRPLDKCLRPNSLLSPLVTSPHFALATALPNCRRLRFLDLAHTRLGTHAAYLADRLRWCRTLSTLDLSGNSGLSDAGVTELAKTLEDPSQLLGSVDLSWFVGRFVLSARCVWTSDCC